MLKTTGLVCALLLIPRIALAQGTGDEVIKNFAPADFEKFLKEDLKKDFTKTAPPQGVEYDIKGTPYIAFFNTQGKFVIFSGRLKRNVPLAKINAWNRDAIFSRAYTVGNFAILEVPMDIAAGTTRNMLKSYYERLEDESKKFVAFIQAGKGPGDKQGQGAAQLRDEAAVQQTPSVTDSLHRPRTSRVPPASGHGERAASPRPGH